MNRKITEKRELMELIKKGETQKVELKSRIDDGLGKSICSFANTSKGTVLVGVSDEKKILGVHKKHEQDIANIAHTCKPSVYPEIQAMEVDGKNIFVVKVKKSGSLHSFKNIAYKRVGTHDKPLSPEEVIRFAKDTGKIRWDEQACKGATLRDIDEVKVRWFLRKARAERNFDIETETPLKEVLERLKLLRNGELTIAAVLLFGKDPQKYLLQAKIRCARFKGTTAVDFLDMKLIEGNIIDQVDSAEGFVLSHVRKAAKVVMFKREEVWEYPPDALREAIVNAVCHRDYESPGNIKIAVFDDRVEISDPGKLPEPLTPEILKQNHESVPRNKLIANAFFLIRNIEQWGKGTNKIVQWCVEHGLKEPDFVEIGGGFLVKFHSPEDLLSLIPEKGKVDLRKLGLNERQVEALGLMVNEGREFTNRKYCNTLNVSRATAFRELSELVNKGQISERGRFRNKVYFYEAFSETMKRKMKRKSNDKKQNSNMQSDVQSSIESRKRKVGEKIKLKGD